MRRFFQHVLPAVLKPLHVLWNEMIGFFFAVMALFILIGLIRGVMDFKGDADSLFKIVLMGLAFVVMAGYGLQSYFKARKISRT
jgi:hypothetical protein